MHKKHESTGTIRNVCVVDVIKYDGAPAAGIPGLRHTDIPPQQKTIYVSGKPQDKAEHSKCKHMKLVAVELCQSHGHSWPLEPWVGVFPGFRRKQGEWILLDEKALQELMRGDPMPDFHDMTTQPDQLARKLKDRRVTVATHDINAEAAWYRVPNNTGMGDIPPVDDITMQPSSTGGNIACRVAYRCRHTRLDHPQPPIN